MTEEIVNKHIILGFAYEKKNTKNAMVISISNTPLS